MAPPANHSCLKLRLLPKRYFVVKTDGLPSFVTNAVENYRSGKFFSLTITDEEVSVVGEEFEGMPANVEECATWRCIKIKGPMEFGLVGVIALFTAPLKENRIPCFVTSTWNTDYILVSLNDAERAVEILKADGWDFEE